MFGGDWLCHSMRLFYFIIYWKYRCFLQFSPSMDSMLRSFYGSFLWNFKKALIVCGCFIYTIQWKIQPFFPFSPWRDTRLRHFAGYPFGASRKKASTIFITQPLRKSQPFSMTQPFYYGRVSGIFGDATVNVCCFLSWSFREGEPTKCLMLCRCFTYNYLKSFLTIFCDLKIIRYFQ